MILHRKSMSAIKGMAVKASRTVQDVDKSFAEVFPYIEKGKLYYIDDESYFVAEKEN